jgi:hypothetical protein
MRHRRVYTASLVAALAFLPWLTFFVRLHGRALLGCDTEPALDPRLLLGAATSIFSDHFFFGFDTSLAFGSIFPHLALLRLAQMLGANMADANKLELAALWSIGIVFAFQFFRAIGIRGYAALAATVVYGAGPIAYSMFNTPTVAGAGGYCVTPIALAAVATPQRYRIRAWILATFAGLMLPFASQDPAYAAMPVLASIGLVVAFFAARIVPRAQSAYCALLIAWIVGLNVWWLVPEGIGFYHLGKQLEATKLNRIYDVTSITRTATDNAPLYLLRLANRDLFRQAIWDGPWGVYMTRAQALAPYFASLAVQLALAIPTLFAVISLVRLPVTKRLRRMAIALGSLAVVFYLLAAGEAFPATPLAAVLYRLPAYTMFREPYSKFGIALTLFVAALFGLALQRWRTRIARIAALIFIAAMLAPMIVGRALAVDADGHPLLGVRIPQSVYALGRDLDRLSRNEPGRFLQLPLSQNYSLEHFSWGYVGPGFYSNLIDAPIIGAVSSPSLDNKTNRFIGHLANAAVSGDYSAFHTLANEGAIRGIIWEGDLVPTFGGLGPSAVARHVLSIPGFTRYRRYGALALYLDRTPVPMVAAMPAGTHALACKPFARVEASTQTSWTIAVRGACDADVVVKVQYSAEWRATAARDGSVLSVSPAHFRAYGYANGWRLPPGTWTLHMWYAPRALARLAIEAEIFALAFLVIAGFLILRILRKARA